MWPYKPPSEYDVKPLSDVYRPPGYLLLSEVVEMVGKATMGEEWTGEELKARSLTNVILEESSHLENTSPWVPPGGIVFVGVGRHLSPIRERWKVITTRGNRFVNSEEEARALWNQEEPNLRDMWDREDAARQRHTTIARKLQRSLNAAVLPSWAHRPDVGDRKEIPTDVWGRDNIPSVFELGDSFRAWRAPNFIKFMDVDANGLTVSVEGRVVLLQSDVERYIAPAPKPTMPGHPPEPAEAEHRPLDKHHHSRDVEADALLKNRIETVIAKAKTRWPDPETRPGVNQMALMLVDGQPKSKVQNYGQDAIRKILADTYKPAMRFSIPGLSSG